MLLQIVTGMSHCGGGEVVANSINISLSASASLW